MPSAQQAKCWDTEVYSKDWVDSKTSSARTLENNHQIHLPEGKGLKGILGIKNKESGWFEVGETCVNVLEKEQQLCNCYSQLCLVAVAQTRHS